MGATDAIQAQKKATDYCTFCPKMCRFGCPVAEATKKESHTPTAKVTSLRLVREAKVELTADVASQFYACTGCGQSRNLCAHRIEVPPQLYAGRALAVERGVAPPSAARLAATLKECGNRYGPSLDARVGDLESSGMKDPNAVLFVGCVTARHFPENVRDTARLLSRIGVRARVYRADALCSGYPALAMGLPEEARRLAGIHGKALANAGRVVAGCPACVHMLRNVYPTFGVRLRAEVWHVAEILAERLKTGALHIARKKGPPILYHDPCHLGRTLGVYDAPRALLSRAREAPLLEFPWKRRDAECSGGGGVLPLVMPEVALRIARNRLAQAPSAEADLVTACPSCLRMFQKAGRPARDLVNVLE